VSLTGSYTDAALNLGSGDKVADGWVDFDVTKVMRCDVQGTARRLPFQDESFVEAKAEHVLEHIPKEHLIETVNECWRVLRPEGVLLGLFGATASHEARYTKYVIVDPVQLKYRGYPGARARQPVLPNRDIIRLFSTLRVSDSFLLKNKIREILFRKTGWEDGGEARV
jgi:predicted SAM-dependent methyltransferase